MDTVERLDVERHPPGGDRHGDVRVSVGECPIGSCRGRSSSRGRASPLGESAAARSGPDVPATRIQFRHDKTSVVRPVRRRRRGVRPESVRAGARGSHAAHARSDARDRQRSLRRARDAPRAGARAVSAHPADLRIPGPLPRERGDGRLREGVRLLERRDRVVPVAAAQLGADDGRAVADDADRAEEALRHPRRRGVGGGQQRRTATSPASWWTSASARAPRTTPART